MTEPYVPPLPVDPEIRAFDIGADLKPLAHDPAHDWWRAFDDPLLERWIEAAFEANLDLTVARANLRAAQAALRLQRIAERPTGSLDADADYGQPALAGGPVQVDVDPQTVLSLSGSALWEIDLFGRLDALETAARADVEARRWDRRDVQAILAASVARAWLDVRAAEEALSITQANIDIQTNSQALTQIRFEEGFATQLDTALASSQLLTTRALMPPLRADRTVALNRLATLTAQPVGLIERALEAEVGPPTGLPDRLPASLPLGDVSGLIRRRADIRAAERDYAGAFAQTNVVRTDYFPRLSLNGRFAVVGTSIGNLTGPNAFGFGFGPQLVWEGLDRPAVTARLSVAEATEDVALATYQSAILNALEETQAQFAVFSRQNERLSILLEAERELTSAVALSRIRYEEGEDDFLAVLDAEARLLETSRAALEARRSIFASTISVYQALGAGWSE